MITSALSLHFNFNLFSGQFTEQTDFTHAYRSSNFMSTNETFVKSIDDGTWNHCLNIQPILCNVADNRTMPNMINTDQNPGIDLKYLLIPTISGPKLHLAST